MLQAKKGKRKERKTSAKCKSGTTVLLVQHLAPWSPWSPWSTLIHLGPQFPECDYTKWSKQDQGGPGVVPGLRQDHGAGWWTRSIQDHRGPLKNFFLIRKPGKKYLGRTTIHLMSLRKEKKP